MQSTTPQTVIVAFDVFADTREEAEAEVEARFNTVRFLWQNDSTDIERGTLDQISTFTVVPLGKLLKDSL